MEKQKEKEERDELLEKLDEDFADIASILSSYKRQKEEKKVMSRMELFNIKPSDDFEKIVRELAFEARARATDRLKTPEEIAQEEKKKLEELEVWNVGVRTYFV